MGGAPRATVRIAPDAAGGLNVEMPRALRRVVLGEADAVRSSATDPAAPGHERLFGRIHQIGDDDPLSTLRRQQGVEEACATVSRTWDHGHLAEEEAEAWLQVLSLALAVRAHALDVRDDDDVAGLDELDAAPLRLLQALQVLLVDALATPEAEG